MVETIAIFPAGQASESQLQIVNAREMLLGELALSDALLTGTRVACALQTEDHRYYLGHNIEHQDAQAVRFEHAEDIALQLLPVRALINRVYIAGQGSLKRISPCEDCYEALSPRLAPDAEFVLFRPNTLDEAVVFSPKDRHEAYDRKPYSAIEATNRDAIIAELRQKTDVTEQDAELLADLRLTGLQTGISFFLTGSASGRGWTSTTLHKLRGTTYEDLDIAAVTTLGPAAVRKLTKAVVKQYHGRIDQIETTANVWRVSGVNRGQHATLRYVSFKKDGRQLMDLLVAPTLEEAMVRSDYLTKNFYHKLS